MVRGMGVDGGGGMGGDGGGGAHHVIPHDELGYPRLHQNCELGLGRGSAGKRETNKPSLRSRRNLAFIYIL